MRRLVFFLTSLLITPSVALAEDKPPLPPEVTAEAADPEEPAAAAAGSIDVVELEGQVLVDPTVEPPPAEYEYEPLVIVEQQTAPTPVVVAPPRDRGTFGILELQAGATLNGELGEAGGALFGLGGKPVGFPWRFYFITEIGQAHVRDAGFVDTGMFAADRRYWDVAAGLRIYIPVWGPVRILGDATLGGAYVSSSLVRDDLSPLEANDWYVMGAVAAGVQARILHQLSIGVRAKLMVADDGLSDLRDMLEIAPSLPTTLTAGLTWHI